jgi:hypothetical protein
LPEAAVKSARNDHIRMAVNPIKVARSFIMSPETGDRLRQLALYFTALIVTVPYCVGILT